MPLRILVVDDNRDTLRKYTKALQRQIKLKEWDRSRAENSNDSSILQVESADSVVSALEKLKEQTFEILVVDLKIPGSSGEEMGGLELISESLKLAPLRPIIAITGYGSIALARKTLTQGVFDFIEKSTTAIDELINAVQRAIDCRDDKIKRSGNPFTPMTGVEPTVFGGRTKELEFFEQKLHRALYAKRCEHFLVLGNWGIGKSTLLREYKKICQSRGHIASIVSLEPLQAGTTTSEAARSIVEGIIRDIPYPLNRLKQVVNYFDSVGINILGSGIELARNTAQKELSAQAFLHDSLIKLWQDLEDKTGVLVILLDELENLMTVPEVFMTLKSTLSMPVFSNSKILVGIASTEVSWLELTSIQKHHPLSRYFLSRVELGLLSENEVQDTIITSLIGTGISFCPEVIRQVIEYTQGHPFEMQLLCYHLFNNQLSNHVNSEVWEQALHATLNDIGIAIFERWFSQASRQEAIVLRVIAEAEQTISVKQIERVMEVNQIPLSNIGKCLQRLLEKKLISRSSRGLYIMPDRMFRAYVRTRFKR